MSAEVKDIDRAAVSQPTSDTEQDEDEQSSELTAPGQRLRAAREAAGLEQAEIAAEMRLDLKLIRALEEGDLEHLPEPVFTAGYLRSYARLMGLPPDELVAQYVDSETRDLPPLDNHRRELPERYRKVAHALPSSFSLSTARRLKDSKSGQQAVMIAGIIVVVIAAAWGTKYWLMRPQTAPLVGQVQSDVDLKQGKAANTEVIPSQSKTTTDNAAAARRASGNKPGTDRKSVV